MLIITPNPAIDHTVQLAELRLGEVLRTGPGMSVAGGKGGNVSRAAKCLGVDSAVLAFVPEVGGEHLQNLYAAEGFTLLPVTVPGRVRTCTAMVEADGQVTLLNEPGAQVTAADWQRLISRMTSYLADSAGPGPVVCSGSLPPGSPTDAYAQLVAAGHAAGREVIVDASGPVLAAALAAGADVVSPNVAEAERMLGTAGDGAEAVHDDGDDVPERAAAAARGLLAAGAKWAIVTGGAAGAAVAGRADSDRTDSDRTDSDRADSGREITAWLPAPRVAVRNPIGAGDSFLAGVATARIGGADWLTAIRRGLAAGSASVEQMKAGVVDPARVDELEQQIIAAAATASGI